MKLGEIITKEGNIKINEDLEDSPESVNSDPYGEGWIVKVSIDNAGELDELMTPEQYGDLIC